MSNYNNRHKVSYTIRVHKKYFIICFFSLKCYQDTMSIQCMDKKSYIRLYLSSTCKKEKEQKKHNHLYYKKKLSQRST